MLQKKFDFGLNYSFQRKTHPRDISLWNIGEGKKKKKADYWYPCKYFLSPQILLLNNSAPFLPQCYVTRRKEEYTNPRGDSITAFKHREESVRIGWNQQNLFEIKSWSLLKQWGNLQEIYRFASSALIYSLPFNVTSIKKFKRKKSWSTRVRQTSPKEKKKTSNNIQNSISQK